MDDASFPGLVNQISCLLLHYLHIGAIALLLFVLLLSRFAARCICIMDSLEMHKIGRNGGRHWPLINMLCFSLQLLIASGTNLS